MDTNIRKGNGQIKQQDQETSKLSGTNRKVTVKDFRLEDGMIKMRIRVNSNSKNAKNGNVERHQS